MLQSQLQQPIEVELIYQLLIENFFFICWLTFFSLVFCFILVVALQTHLYPII